MKVYRGRRGPEGAPQGTSVTVTDETGTRPLRHLVHHSPTGLAWGYAGSGPADLARSLVGDIDGDPDPHPALYQEVKRRLVANFPEEAWELTEAQLREVLDELRDPRLNAAGLDAAGLDAAGLDAAGLAGAGSLPE